MANNDLLERIKKQNKAHFDAGVKTGRQQIIDMVSLVLRDPNMTTGKESGSDGKNNNRNSRWR